ncbi:MAG: hypothetical protein A3K19_30790 [Lentisphaerae bacterium RIFOXYB12_FULL_65_16]|nr:MAG: hypothetical protein A3K18_04105 [Lentisphaerae bacterium RIFOXYA12_64_32]OGV88805.1 MAG: hypothetical protein A3K19_30790 [Lentisphaerae bacterium RIFOXYB12_FULL_65_16]
MSASGDALELVGLSRPSSGSCGFVIPVFRDVAGRLVVQEAGADGRITGFAPYPADASALSDAPLRAPEGVPWSARVGQSLLYAFQCPDGRVMVGPREEVGAAVREELPNLCAQPFVWAEAARFVGDVEQLRQAETETAKLLRHPSWRKQTVGAFTAGTSTPAHRLGADALRLDEKSHVEEPLLKQLAALDWSVLRLDMHQQTPADSGRKDFGEVVLRERLTRSLVTINDWLDPDQVAEVVDRLARGETPVARGGIVWHTQGSGKSLTMVFAVRELRRRPGLQDWKIVFVTDRTQLEQQLGETSQSIGQTVRVAQWIKPRPDRPGESLFELLRDPSSNCVMAMDAAFQDVFSEYRLTERLQILGYGTRDAYLDAKPTIEAKARDMVRHYARHVFPGGYKAQVVASSRMAAVRYAEALRDAIAAEAEALRTDNPLCVNAEELRAVEVGLVITWGNNDDVEIKDAMRGVDPEAVVKRFKLPFGGEEKVGEKTVNGRIGFVVVNEMLVTGFDAPLEQVLYLDRVMKDHGLLQAIARVNRVHDEGKDCGLVVDYVGVGNNLRLALDKYKAREQQEMIECLTPASVVIGDLKQALDETLAFLARNGLSDSSEAEAFFDLFYDEDLRFEYITAARKLTAAFAKALPRAEALDYLKVYQRLVAINELACQFLRDGRLSMKGVPRKLRGITDQFLVSQGVTQKVAPISVLDPEFQKHAQQRQRAKTSAAEVEHAIRHHIEVNFDEDPALFASLAEELEKILKEFAGNWERISQEMEKLRQKLMAKEKEETHGLDRKREMPIFRVLQAALFPETALDEPRTAALVNLTQLLFQTIQTEIRQAGFWDAPLKQKRLEGEVKKELLGPEYYQFGPMIAAHQTITARLMEWARRNDKLIRRP